MSFKIVRFDLALEKFGLKPPKSIRRPLFRFLKLYQADDLVYQSKQASPLIAENAGYALKHLNITYDFDPRQLQPFIGKRNLVACNHPTGFLEVFILMDILKKAGLDVHFLANDCISIIPDVNQIVIPVDVYSEDRHTRVQSVRSIMGCLKKGKTLAAFPSGSVSRFNWKKLKVEEMPWNQNLLDMATRSNANIIKLSVKARNSWLFYVASMLHPLLPTLFLFREYFNKKGRHFHVALEEIVESTT